jgi:hypothetical protein
MTGQDTVGNITEPWRSWLGDWLDDFDPEFPIIFYETDGLDTSEEFDAFPHLAIRDDAPKTISGAECALIWPVDVEGWADIRTLGWQGVLLLLKAGKRTEED